MGRRTTPRRLLRATVECAASDNTTRGYRRRVFASVGGFDSTVDASADADMYMRLARRFAVCSHEEVVAEYRQHGVNMSSNPARMLKASLTVLRKQRRHV